MDKTAIAVAAGLQITIYLDQNNIRADNILLFLWL